MYSGVTCCILYCIVTLSHAVCSCECILTQIDSKGNYSATSNNTKLVHCWWVGCYIWYSEEGLGQAAALPFSSSLYQM